MKRFKAFCTVTVSAAIVALMCVTAFAASSLGIEGPCYAILSPVSPGSIAVTWWDVPEASAGYAQYSTSSFNGSEAPEDILTVGGYITRLDTGYSAFEARMTDLTDGATYYYRVGNGEFWSDIHSFVFDAGYGNGSASFLYLGDIQYDNYNSGDADYAAWEALIQGAYRANSDIGFAILGGDMVQQGQNASDWRRFLDHASSVFNEVPLLAVPGNHESNTASGKPLTYLDLMALPENGPAGFTEEFYSYDYGDCHIVALSSQIYAYEQLRGGSMSEADFEIIADWIKADLAASDAMWKIVVMHHPAYAVVPDSVSAGVLQNWEPILEEAQVDLILCGHQHVYMRTTAIRGVTQIMGNSGSKHYAPADVEYSEVIIGYISNYQIVNADSSALTVTSYDADGGVIDFVTLTAKDRSEVPDLPGIDGDLDGDGVITENDVGILLDAIRFYRAYSDALDLNGDGKIDICDAHLLALRVVTE